MNDDRCRLPHREGTRNGGTQDCIQATLGAYNVDVDYARTVPGTTAAEVFGFDVNSPAPVADRVVPLAEYVLTPPAQDKFPHGDVHKPLGGANIG